MAALRHVFAAYRPFAPSRPSCLVSSDVPTLGMKRSHLGNQPVPVMGTKKSPQPARAVDFFLSYCRLDYFRPSLVFT